MSRFAMTRLRGMSGFLALSFLRSLRAVLRSSLHASLDADRVERAADDVVTDARQILHAAAADEHQRVLLEVVPDARDVGRHLDAVRQPHAGDLAKRGVRLLRRLGEDAHAHAALLRAVLQRGALGLADDLLAPGADELTDSRHNPEFSKCGVGTADCDGGFASAIPNPRSAIRGFAAVASGLEASFQRRRTLGA